VDESEAMLDWNKIDQKPRDDFQVCISDIEAGPFGLEEFDWIFAVLADPYNTEQAWENISRALRAGGECVFIVPSFAWRDKFRARSAEERAGHARFLTKKGLEVFLPSIILDEVHQEAIVKQSGLVLDRIDHVRIRDMPKIRSPKISNFLEADDPIVDIYRTKKSKPAV
jgi:SAM-dependent methyltransferase